MSAAENHKNILLMVVAATAIYFASRAAADALTGPRVSPGKIAVGHWLPIAVAALWAAATGRGEVAVGLAFGTAVASLTLAAGAAALLAPPVPGLLAKSVWPMLVPAAVLAFLAGFKGSVTGVNAGVLAIEGLFILALWLRPGGTAQERAADEMSRRPAVSPQTRVPTLSYQSAPVGPAGRPGPRQSIEPPVDPSSDSTRPRWVRPVQLILAVALAAVGAWLALTGLDRTVAASGNVTVGLLTTTLLSPLLVLPVIGTGADLAQRGESSAAVSSHVGIALLNVCGLVPLIYLCSGTAFVCRTWRESLHRWTVGEPVGVPAVPFPAAVWRIDVLFLVAAGMFLMPVALGRWGLGKHSGLWMMTAFAVYLVLPILLLRFGR